MGEGTFWNRGKLGGRQTRQKAAEDDDLNIVYNRIPTTTVATEIKKKGPTVATEIKKEGLTKWQRQWERADKGALCRAFFRQSNRECN